MLAANNQPLKILVVGNTLLTKEFRALGHCATSIGTWSSSDIRITADDFSLDRLLELASPQIVPDVILQIETLGSQRYLIEGLGERKIPAFFFALDCHLNMLWQTEYAQLFDGVFATQKNCALRFFECCRVSSHVAWGFDENVFFDRHVRRDYDVSFVGTLDAENRIKRGKIIERIQKKGISLKLFGTNPQERLSASEMAEVFSRSKVVINESILAEVNMRYFEAMPCGAMLLTEDIGENLGQLFLRGKHLDCYTPYDLEEKLEFYLSNDSKRIAIAEEGKRHCLEVHTWKHRAEEILKIIAPSVRQFRSGGTFTKLSAAEKELCLGRAWYYCARAGLVTQEEGLKTAQRHCELAVKNDPTSFLANFFSGIVDADRGLVDEAVKCFGFASGLVTDSERYQVLLRLYFGLFCLHLGNLELARNCLRAITALAPEFATKHGSLWEATINEALPSAQFYFFSGKLLEFIGLEMEVGSYQTGESIFPLFAMDCYRLCVAMDENYVEAYLAFAEVCLRNHMFELALDSYLSACELGYKDQAVLSKLTVAKEKAYF